MYDVVIVGCGPTGALLAAELRLHQVRVLVLERETEPTAAIRIVGLHIRSLELLAMRGLLDRLLPLGRRRPAATYFAAIDRPAPADLDSPYAYLLGIRQPALVQVLEDHASTLGAHIRRGATVTTVDQTDDHVTVHLHTGEKLRSRYLVACDGAHSTVRKATGIAFPGEPSRNDTLMGELAATTAPTSSFPRLTFTPTGSGTYRVIVPAPEISTRSDQPTIHDFQQALRALTGTDFGLHSPRWLSRFGDATRLADHYRVHRVLLAGDAAHVHPPIGGQGLNLGLQDAVNLGWKLAADVNGWAPPTLLDTYHDERHPVAAAVLDNTRAQTALLAPTPGARAARHLLEELTAYEDVARHLVRKVAALDIRYDFAGTPDLLGRRLPDLETKNGPLYPQLHRARPLLLDTTERLTTGPWSDRVDHLPDPTAALPAPALLLRPDGHIAWLGTTQNDLNTHLTRWFGTPTA